jgi:hypothetical protein
MLNYFKQYFQKKKLKKKIYLYASGSTGSVFVHSLISNHKKILSIPVILDTERIYRHLLNSNKSLINILNENTFFSFLTKKIKTERYGDFSEYNDLNLDYFCEQLSELEKNKQLLTNYKNFSYQFYVAFLNSIPKKKFEYVLEHSHNLYPNKRKNYGAITNILKLDRKAKILVTTRHPYSNFYSFCKYYNKDYNRITKILIEMKTEINEIKKNFQNIYFIKIEKLNENPREEMGKILEYLNLEFDENTLFSKIANKPLVSKSSSGQLIQGFSKNLNKGDLMEEKDKYLINYLYQDYFKLFNYLPETIKKKNYDLLEISKNFVNIKHDNLNNLEERKLAINKLLKSI